jgi:putative salt-induced outer membrane protein
MSVTRVWVITTALLASSRALTAWADDPPPPPPQHEWIGKGQLGFLESKGNSDAESINGSIDMSRYDDAWKNAFYIGGLYGKNSGIVSGERIEAREQTNYDLSPRTFVFGALRYEHDEFDGFEYQASVTGGAGFKIIDSADTKLTAQVGAGYRRLRPETLNKDPDGSGEVLSRTPGDATGEAIGTLGIDFSHQFNASTALTNKFLMEYGSTDTLAHDEIALAVKMSKKLALSVGYAVTDNSSPPPPLKKIDTLTTVNLVFSF